MTAEQANIPIAEDLLFDYQWAKENADRRKFYGSEIVKLIKRVAAAEWKFTRHTEHVQLFLSEMYATMIDPVEESNLKVGDLCDLLLKRATDDQQATHDLEELVAQLKAENLRLKAPVSDEEWYDAVMVGSTILAHVNALLTARTQGGSK